MSESEIPNEELPDEIVRDILSRLPVKTLMQFKCVSKHWRDLMADANFVESHFKKAVALSSRHRILVPTSPLRSLDYNISPDNINISTELDCPFLKPRTSIKILGSCNGLVCLIDGTQDIIIYNPSTRRYFDPFQLPQKVLYRSNRIEFVYGFSCGTSPSDIRFVRFPRFARDSEYIKYNRRGVTANSWMSGVVSPGYDFIDTVGTFLNGALHWLAHYSDDDYEDRVIASFNVCEGTFTDLTLPYREACLPFYILGVLRGCLSALVDDICYKEVEVWLMKEYGVVESWERFIKIPLNTGIENISYMIPLKSINDEEILLEIDLQSFVIYNVKKKKFSGVTKVQDKKWFGDAAVYVESLLSPDVLKLWY